MQPDFPASFLGMEREINTSGEGGKLRTTLFSILPAKPIVHAAPRHLLMLSCLLIYFQAKRSEKKIKLEEQTYLSLFSTPPPPPPFPHPQQQQKREKNSFTPLNIFRRAQQNRFSTHPLSRPHISSQVKQRGSGRNCTGRFRRLLIPFLKNKINKKNWRGVELRSTSKRETHFPNRMVKNKNVINEGEGFEKGGIHLLWWCKSGSKITMI